MQLKIQCPTRNCPNGNEQWQHSLKKRQVLERTCCKIVQANVDWPLHQWHHHHKLRGSHSYSWGESPIQVKQIGIEFVSLQNARNFFLSRFVNNGRLYECKKKSSTKGVKWFIMSPIFLFVCSLTPNLAKKRQS